MIHLFLSFVSNGTTIKHYYGLLGYKTLSLTFNPENLKTAVELFRG